MAVPAKEKKSPVFDWEAGEFKIGLNNAVEVATEERAVEQVVIKALQTWRGVYLIYANVDQAALDHAYGSDVRNVLAASGLSEETRISELERTVREALIYLDWINAVYDVEINRQGTDEATATFKVGTVFDDEQLVEGVNLSNE